MATQFEQAKWIPGTKFLVDGFRYSCTDCKHYFLTHAHSDHTTGLFKGWNKGTIYCTPVTARLIIQEAGIPASVVRRIPVDSSLLVDGVTVTAVCANHCPGAVMFLFAVPQADASKRQILHTGDFRFHPRMLAYPALAKVQLHTLFLDTTYASPKWCFPDQDEAVRIMVDIMKAAKAAKPGACEQIRVCP